MCNKKPIGECCEMRMCETSVNIMWGQFWYFVGTVPITAVLPSILKALNWWRIQNTVVIKFHNLTTYSLCWKQEIVIIVRSAFNNAHIKVLLCLRISIGLPIVTWGRGYFRELNLKLARSLNGVAPILTHNDGKRPHSINSSKDKQGRGHTPATEKSRFTSRLVPCRLIHLLASILLFLILLSNEALKLCTSIDGCDRVEINKFMHAVSEENIPKKVVCKQ